MIATTQMFLFWEEYILVEYDKLFSKFQFQNISLSATKWGGRAFKIWTQITLNKERICVKGVPGLQEGPEYSAVTSYCLRVRVYGEEIALCCPCNCGK